MQCHRAPPETLAQQLAVRHAKKISVLVILMYQLTIGWMHQYWRQHMAHC
jgi:hypothetical protein